ncbi:PLP-dependent aminotransferase family protein [Photobacterium minamisatsumaniensis]|uniref:aminotransferase-like domain-containing protein n=1 Tax=Photobacterium minamisatsumaniensis TaxID=2910233 RepID=UPI003D0F3750
MKNDMISILIKALSSSFDPKYRIIYNFILQKIRNNELVAGQKLPPHRQLAAQIFVTSVTVSRAYKELEKSGAIITCVGKGSFVRDNSLNTENQGVFHNFRGEGSFFDLSRSSSILTNSVAPILQTFFETQRETKLITSLLSNSIVDSPLSEYGPELGHQHHREAGLRWLSLSGVDATNEQITCTNGAQHALLCAILIATNSGDTIISESFTYPGVIQLCRQLGRKLVGLAYDEYGLLPDALAHFCQCNTCSALYLSPQIHNPTGTVMPCQRRLELIDICRQYNIIILEDDVFGVLHPQREKPLQFYAQERTLLFSSLSKIAMPGLRAGYLVFPSALRSKATNVLRDTCWMASPLSHQAATELINSGAAFSLLAHLRQEIVRRKACVEELLSNFTYSTSQYCPHYYIEMPKNKSATHISTKLHERGVSVMSSESFAVSMQDKHRFVRASVSAVHDNNALVQAFKTLKECIEEN